MFGRKSLGAIYDILRGVNATLWGGVEEADKVGKIVKTGLSGADVVIGTSHALEDFSCNDPICASLDVIGSVSSAAGLVLGNIPATKSFVGCRTVRYYCKNYGTFWGCTAAVGKGLQSCFKFVVNKPI